MFHISELYGIDIYTDDGKYIGKANDVILNLEKGNIVRVTTEPLRFVSKDRAKNILKEKSILYKNVKSVGDIMIVSKGRVSEPSSEEVDARLSNNFRRRSLLGRTR